jgi:hypothetical protein
MEALAASFLYQGLWVGVTSAYGLPSSQRQSLSAAEGRRPSECWVAWEAAGRLLMLITGKQIDNLPEA